MEFSSLIVERDDTNRKIETKIKNGKATREEVLDAHSNRLRGHRRVLDLVSKVFLPAGYPDSVSPDYLRYQILNALQAFCNSLAGLLSSRAILEGFGVGDPSATATNALLLTVLQDVFSRLTTIVAAHILGSSLAPDAKKYRLLADMLNDAAVILDTISPRLDTLFFPGLRVAALCLSASFRSLCAISAGGSKASISLHFATPLKGTGDVGDLNAKDASKETVLALLGMLLGTLIVPHLTTPWTTYTTLIFLVGLHLTINYIGVRGLVLRTLNGQRTWIAWSAYMHTQPGRAPTPVEVASLERIFERPGAFRDSRSGVLLGHCAIGSSFSEILSGPIPPRLLELFKNERYLLWFDRRCLLRPESPSVEGFLRLHICLKDGYNTEDQLKAWILAAELCRVIPARRDTSDGIDALGLLEETYRKVVELVPDFVEKMQALGWNTHDCALLSGSPVAVVLSVENAPSEATESKKTR